MRSALLFQQNTIILIPLQLSKHESEIWFQYLVYYIMHTCNTNDNRYTAISTSDIYYNPFQCERKVISFGDD